MIKLYVTALIIVARVYLAEWLIKAALRVNSTKISDGRVIDLKVSRALKIINDRY